MSDIAAADLAASLFNKGKLLNDPKTFLKSPPQHVMTLEYSGRYCNMASVQQT